MKNLMISLGLILLMTMLLEFQTELNLRIWKNLRNEPISTEASQEQEPEKDAYRF